MSKIFDLLKRRAVARQPMPTNIELGELIGGRGRQSIAKAVDKLEAQRRIRVDLRRGLRRVYIPSCKAITGWGEHKLGHAPYCLNARGSVPALTAPPAPRRLARGDGLFLLGIPVTEEFAFRAAIFSEQPAIGAARRCQFSCHENFEEANSCGAKTVSGKSWCAEHLAQVFTTLSKRDIETFNLTQQPDVLLNDAPKEHK